MFHDFYDKNWRIFQSMFLSLLLFCFLKKKKNGKKGRYFYIQFDKKRKLKIGSFLFSIYPIWKVFFQRAGKWLECTRARRFVAQPRNFARVNSKLRSFQVAFLRRHFSPTENKCETWNDRRIGFDVDLKCWEWKARENIGSLTSHQFLPGQNFPDSRRKGWINGGRKSCIDLFPREQPSK